MVSQIDMKALNVFVQTPVSQDMIHKLVVTTLQVIPCHDDKSKKAGKQLPSLMTFINKLVRYTNVYTGTLMATLVYLDRLKHKLPKNAQGMPCTRHRIFLSCLILALKFHNDLLPKNVHWAKYTEGHFSVTDINLMERQLLYLLNWDIHVLNDEMVAQLGRFLDPIRDELVKSQQMRHFLHKQQQQVAAQMAAHRRADDLPAISRSSSTALHLSLGRPHSRASSVALVSTGASPTHMRQASYSSVELVSPLVEKWVGGVDPSIERAARAEEAQLAKMLSVLGH